MRRLLFLLLAAPCLWAEGPQYGHKDANTNQEFQNVYNDIRNIFNKTIPSMAVSTMTVSSATISSATIGTLGLTGELKPGLTSSTSGQVLISAGPNIAPFFGAASSTGRILQIVTTHTITAASSTSSTFAETTLSTTITPTSATSKIFIGVSQSVSGIGNNNSIDARLRMIRDSTNITPATDYRLLGVNFTSTYESDHQFAFALIDSPATTSSVRYKTQFNRQAGAGTVTVQRLNNSFNSPSNMVLIEIGQ